MKAFITIVALYLLMACGSSETSKVHLKSGVYEVKLTYERDEFGFAEVGAEHLVEWSIDRHGDIYSYRVGEQEEVYGTWQEVGESEDGITFSTLSVADHYGCEFVTLLNLKIVPATRTTFSGYGIIYVEGGSASVEECNISGAVTVIKCAGRHK